MEELEFFFHECELTSPEIIADGICCICYKDETVEFTCKPCNFNICKGCSKLPENVSHDFHPEHLLEFCRHEYDQKPGYIICSGCGNMSSGSFYKCKECEIYLDLGCALMENIFRGWDAKEMLHYSHRHLLKRCRPGQDAQGSCLLCEIPLSPSSICYGCVYCYSFFHERCLDLPTEIQHPVHPAHPLIRLDYMQILGKGGDYKAIFGKGRDCNACRETFGVRFGCIECNFQLHLRCADSLLRGLMHKSHPHLLFYVASNASEVFRSYSICQICKGTDIISLDSYYHCVECNLKFHFECLEIPLSVLKKSCHIHPLVCTTFLAGNESLEYCCVCETIVHAGHHTYSCEECDFLAHIECILHKEAHWPLYLKDLYSCDEGINRPTYGQDLETEELENKLMVSGIEHIHVMRPVTMDEIISNRFNMSCGMCHGDILGSPCKCETCDFKTHSFCAELAKPSTRRLHLNHPHFLTLLPKTPTRDGMSCEICKEDITMFNLFCRLCDFIIDVHCALKGKLSHRLLGQKPIRNVRGRCMSGEHKMVQVLISISYPIDCVICDESFYGKAMSCMTCEEIYHPRCVMLWRRWVVHHPLHSDHKIGIFLTRGFTCRICLESTIKYGYSCRTCQGLNFHVKCFEATSVLEKDMSHSHIFYNFGINDFHSARSCSVCGTPYKDSEDWSFYGCIDCNFSGHVRCIGFPANVKTRRHQHTVVQKYSSDEKDCSFCGSCYSYSERTKPIYTCNHCDDTFHLDCLMPQFDNEPATDQEQIIQIYLMYLERDLLDLFQEDLESDDGDDSDDTDDSDDSDDSDES